MVPLQQVSPVLCGLGMFQMLLRLLVLVFTIKLELVNLLKKILEFKAA
ncbi:hypothetical protein OPIT5_26345 [Opitutaceae bacterium TAV5]|nr:hypothetical protein OPIT5_26345 [Opitutaceae bacterium TAV5]